MDSPTIHQLRVKRLARRCAYSSSAACHCMAESESVVGAQCTVPSSVPSTSADRSAVLVTPKLVHGAAWSRPANVQVGEHELPANTCGLSEICMVIGILVRVGDVEHKLPFDSWIAHQHRNLQAQPSRRGPEVLSPVRNL